MSSEKQKKIKQSQKARNRSAKAIPVTAAVLAVVVILDLVLRFLVGTPIPLWITALAGLLLLFTLIGDVVNLLMLDRELKRLERDH